jgi:hypothetical protein
VSAPGDYDNEEIGGMIGRGNRSTRRKPAPVPPCPPQTPHAARTRTRAVAVGSQRLTAELRHGLSLQLDPPAQLKKIIWLTFDYRHLSGASEDSLIFYGSYVKY